MRNAGSRGPDIPFDETVDDPATDPATLEANKRVTDEEIINGRGERQRQWTGTASDIAACRAVNPVSARMFLIADRVWLTRAELEDTCAP